MHLSVAFRALREFWLAHICLRPRLALLKYAFKVRGKKKLWRGGSNIDHSPHDRGDWREDGRQEQDQVSSGRDAENAIWWSNFNQAVKRNVPSAGSFGPVGGGSLSSPRHQLCFSGESCLATCPKFKSSYFLSVRRAMSLRDNFHTLRVFFIFFYYHFSQAKENSFETCQAGGTSLWWRHLLKQTSKSFIVYMICSLTGSGSILTTKLIGFSFLCALKQRWQRLRSESSVANISLNKRHKNQNNNSSQPSTQGHAFKKTKHKQINLSLVVLRTESLCVHKFSKHINKHMYEYIVTLNDQDDSKPWAYWRRDGLHHIESVSVNTFSPTPPSSEGRPGLLSESLSLMRRTTLRRSLADFPPLHREQRDLGARGSPPRRGKLRSPW